MAHPLSFLAGAGVGAGMMYFFDPACGNRRRSLVRDQMNHACSRMQKGADVVRRDASNRAHGLLAELRASMRHDEPDDDTLTERVRARIGRCVSHPSAIEVHAHDGCVTLAGPVLANEIQNLVNNVRRVRGVRQVDPQLEVHNQPGNLSSLQGGVTRYYQPIDLLQENWSPTTRAAVGATALGLLAACLANRSPASMALGTIGFGLGAYATAIQQLPRGKSMARSRPSRANRGDNRPDQFWQQEQSQAAELQAREQRSTQPQGANLPEAAYQRSPADQPDQPAMHDL